MHELSTDSEVTFRRVLGSAEVLPTRPGVDPLEVTRPLPDFSWTTQSPVATSPSVIVRPGTQPPAASHVFGPLTTQVDPENPHREDHTSLHRAGRHTTSVGVIVGSQCRRHFVRPRRDNQGRRQELESGGTGKN